MSGATLGPRQDEPHFVYELIAADGSHLYVGCTNNIAARLGQHRARDWFSEIARIEVDTFPDQRSALDAERERIELYDPAHNVVFTDRYDAGGWERRRQRMAEMHAAGWFCSDRMCKDCRETAHAAKVTCNGWNSGCVVCNDYRPWWTLWTAEERRRHPHWEPLWEDFLEHEPTYAELDAWFKAHPLGASA